MKNSLSVVAYSILIAYLCAKISINMEEKQTKMGGKRLESVIVNGKEYIRNKGNNKSSCAQCEIKAECWDMFHYATPCYGGFYTKKK